MKVTCHVIKDLLPLYVENIASSDTCIIVNAHIQHCPSCRTELETLRIPNDMPLDTSVAPLKKMKSILRKKKYLTIMFSVLLTLSITAMIMGYVMSPTYRPYEEAIVSIEVMDKETVIAKFNDEVSGYDINKYLADDHSGYVYHITTWDSIWNKNIIQNTLPSVVLNPNGEKVVAVYYYVTDGSEDTLIYGKDQEGGVVTLPRLFLTYYAIYAMLFTVLCGFILIIFRKNERVKAIMIKILLFPISYLLAHLFIKGFTAASYSANRDLYAILLVAIPLYGTLLMGRKLPRCLFQTTHHLLE